MPRQNYSRLIGDTGYGLYFKYPVSDPRVKGSNLETLGVEKDEETLALERELLLLAQQIEMVGRFKVIQNW